MERTEKEINDDLCEVDKKLIPLTERRCNLLSELNKYRLDHCGVKVGEVVLALLPRTRNEYAEAVVRSIEYIGCGSPWIKVSFRKKGGLWSKRVQSVYEHWKKK